LIKGIRWAVDKGVDIINISRGFHVNNHNLDFAVLEAAIKLAAQANILVVCAAGDRTEVSGNHLYYPARFEETISVGGIKQDRNLIDNTIDPPGIDIFAPGESIRSTTNIKDSYTTSSGSSQACAYITGVLALLIQKLRES
jgi:large repetitive protein